MDCAEAVRADEVEAAETALRNAALAHADPLALLEDGVARIGAALGASVALGMVSAAHDETAVRCTAWPPETDCALWDLRPADFPALRTGRPLALDAPLDDLGAPCALLVPIDGAAPGVLVLGRREPWDREAVAAGARLAALFSTLWAWAEAEARFQRTVSDLDDALFTFGFAADGRRDYAFVTPQVEALTGLDPDALLAGDADWTDLIVADDRARFEAHEAQLRLGEPSRVDVRVRLGEDLVWLAERATPSLDAAGRPVAGGLLADVTAQKEAEAKLRRARKVAERAAQTRMAFLRMMSHELRTPLGAIRGFAELLGEEVRSLAGAPPEIAEFAATIEEATDRALRLVSDLLDLSRLETGALDLQSRPVDLSALGRLSAARHAAAAPHLAVSDACAPESVDALGDPSRVEQVVEQLLSNATKFTPAGRVAVETGRGEGSVWLAVEDTGVGIEEDFLESLFEPFAQEDTRVNRAFEGTGLGLAIASRLARQMGGQLEVQSRKDAGSRFTLVLPAA